MHSRNRETAVSAYLTRSRLRSRRTVRCDAVGPFELHASGEPETNAATARLSRTVEQVEHSVDGRLTSIAYESCKGMGYQRQP